MADTTINFGSRMFSDIVIPEGSIPTVSVLLWNGSQVVLRPVMDIVVGGSSTPVRHHSLACGYPFGGAPTTMTPTAHTATVARVQPFTLSGPMTLNEIRIRTNAVLANCLRVGIYNSAGTQVFASGALSTVAANWVPVAVSALALAAGDYYFVTTNNNVASTTAAYTVTPAIGAVGVARWGTVVAVAGALPASINPAAILETTGGWMSYVTLSEWTT